MLLHLLGLILVFFLPLSVYGESCDTDCHNQCRIKTKFPPIEFIEPTCHAKCEIAKKAACAAGTDLPTIPITPREQSEQYGTQICATPFQAITGTVIARCSNWDGRLDNQNLINQAIVLLQGSGILLPEEFNGVQIRWCPLSGAHGMAPDRGRIYLDTSLQNDVIATASTLAHELFHLRQYRQLGTDRFKCEYSREYTQCGGCQDHNHSFERDAYEYEDSIQHLLTKSVQSRQVPPGFPSPTVPPIHSGGFSAGFGMQICGCWGFNPPPLAPEPRCQSGRVRVNVCPGFCPSGGNPYAYVCQ